MNKKEGVQISIYILSFEYNSLKKNAAKWNMSSAVYASSMYSRLCMKMSSYLFVRACAMPRMLYLSCAIPFPV